MSRRRRVRRARESVFDDGIGGILLKVMDLNNAIAMGIAEQATSAGRHARYTILQPLTRDRAGGFAMFASAVRRQGWRAW